MIYLLAYVFVVVIGWMFFGTYASSLLETYISISILLAALFSDSEKNGLLYRSFVALLLINSVVDCLILIGFIESKIDVSIPFFIVFSIWMLFILSRKYETESSPDNPFNVMILIKRPVNKFEIIKSLIGFPTPSICIKAGDKIWSFRGRTNTFEVKQSTRFCLNSHISINTGVFATEKIIAQLNYLVGTPRGIGCKCVWSIRNVLNIVGGKYAIKTWFDYIPGVYIMRILG